MKNICIELPDKRLLKVKILMVNDDTWSTGQLVLAEVVESLGEYQKGDIQNVSPQFIVEKIGINKTMDLNLTEIESLAIFERKTKEA